MSTAHRIPRSARGVTGSIAVLVALVMLASVVTDAFLVKDHSQKCTLSSSSPPRRQQPQQQQQQQQQPLEMIASSAPETTTTTTTTTKPTSTKKSDAWFSTRIQKDMGYASRVRSIYLRHVVVERTETAKLAMDWYLQLSAGETVTATNNNDDDDEDDIVVLTTSKDPFGDVAKHLSACSVTRDEGGKLGWVDVPGAKGNADGNDDGTEEFSVAGLLPRDLLDELVALQPKAGDVYILGPSATTNQVHVVRVEELYVPNVLPKAIDRMYGDAEDTDEKLGSFNGVNALIPRNKLKGHGVMPTVPEFRRRTSSSSGQSEEASSPSQKQKQQQQKQRTYAIQTNGCQMNVADSERLEGILQDELGLMPIADRTEINSADVIIFNTCSIRDHAEQKLYDALGPFRARKRQMKSEGNSDFALIVTGCVAQQEGKALLRKIPEIDVVLGPQYVPYLGSVLEQIEWGHQLVVTAPTIIADNYKAAGAVGASSVELSTTSKNTEPVQSRSLTATTTATATATATDATALSSPRIELPENDDFSAKPIRGHSVRAWVNVIYGCNEHCTYCVVPATRGMEQSRSMESILQECLDLVENRGYKEITLLGQNIDAYGRDMVPKRTFANLLHYLNANLPSSATATTTTTTTATRSIRLRYVTSHPRYFSDNVIDAVASLDTVCECFHMPFQAGDNGVLKRMRRGYTFESYMRIIHKIRAASPDAAITADVIVGFPGETEAAFQRTLDLMEAVKFDNLNSFAYSPRPNTEAATWTEDDGDNSNEDGNNEEEDDDDESGERFVVPEEVKKERLARVQELAVRHGLERSQRYLGRTVEVLVEDKNPRKPGQVMGRTRQGRQVFFDGDIDALKGELVDVEITEARTWSLMGRPMQQEQEQ